MATNRWTKLSDLAAKVNTQTKTLTVVPSQRPYISQDGVIYDYHVGHDFTVVDPMSPLQGCQITVCDRHTLKKAYDITHLSIRFNPGMAPVKVAL